VQTVKRTLVALALLFLLLRPVCDAWASGAVHLGSVDGHESVPCCVDLEDGSVVHSSAPAANQVGGAPGKLAPAARTWTFTDTGVMLASGMRHPPDARSNRLSYYARSARILR
jgi:hypothetical protein